MDATTAQAQPASGVEPVAGSAEAFDSLVSRGLFDDKPDIPRYEPEESWSAETGLIPDGPGREPPAKPEAKQEAKPEGEIKPDAKTEAKTETKPEEAKTEEEGKQYESLEHFLKESQLEPESFMQLPVTVKVDGVERAVPLGELQKSYQLSSSAYQRMQEVAAEKASFVTEQQQVRQALGLQIQNAEALLKFAENSLLQDYQAVNWQQLQQENPGQAALLFQQFQARQGAIQQHLGQIQAKRNEETQRAQQAQLQALPRERAKLLEAIPEYRDPEKFAAGQRSMREFANRVGFTDAEINGLYDHRYVRVLDMAARWAALQAKAPATVNRVRTAPQMAKPGTRQVADPRVARTQQAQERWQKSGFRDNEAGAAVFEQFA